jgi:molybdate transport system substrate-binding protein
MRIIGLLALAMLSLRPPQAAPLTVFAASDLGPAFTQIVPRFESATGANVTLVLGSTGVLTQQIRNGAPADVFFAANERFVNDLASEWLVVPHTRTFYAQGRIAIVALESSGIRVADLDALASASIRRIAIANPQHAPYGLAAKEALQKAGLWSALESRLVFGENVQQAVQFVRSGSVQAGIVARSVAGSPDLKWTLVDGRLHAPLNQMAAVVARSKQQKLAMSFIGFVNSADARVAMKQFGFLPPGE